MRFCDKCKVNIADELNNCPLCGRDISLKKNEETSQSFLCYPDNKIWVDKRNFALKIVLWSVIFATLLSCFAEIFLLKTFHYNFYVLTGLFLFIFDIILPLKNHWSFASVSTVAGVSICLYILFIELFTNTFGWGLNYAIPFGLLFMSIYSTTIIFVRNYYQGIEFVISLLIFSILSIAVFLYNTFSAGVVWRSLVSFLTSLTCFIFFLCFKFKRVKQAFKKSFFI